MRLRALTALFALIAVFIGLSVAQSATAAGSECADGWVSQCTVSNGGSHVDVGASETTPGSNSGGSDQAGPPAPPAPEPPPCDGDPRCFSVVMIPDVAISDLASFRPTAPTLAGEPVGLGIAGLPTNLLASASEQQIPGTLLDWDVVVRFVPAGFVFDHGDGTSHRSTTGGASWPALRQAQFTPTATSHVYRARGTYSVSVTVQYEASVDFGTGVWRPVPGYVTATTGGYSVRILEASTALVDESCAEDPLGPGC